MPDLYLIAHKVRGEAAFDVAEQLECPHCKGDGLLMDGDEESRCAECEGLGFWWILSTSGYRAHPWSWVELSQLLEWAGLDINRQLEMPSDALDCFHLSAAPQRNLAELLRSSAPPKTASAAGLKRL